MDEQTVKRFDAVESAVAQNERILEELSDEIRRQEGEIETLKAEVKLLGRQILDLTEGERQ